MLNEDPGVVLIPGHSASPVKAEVPEAAAVKAGNERAAGLEDAPHLQQPRRPIGQVAEHRTAVDEVERVGRSCERWSGVVDEQVDVGRKMALEPLDRRGVNITTREE